MNMHGVQSRAKTRPTTRTFKESPVKRSLSLAGFGLLATLLNTATALAADPTPGLEALKQLGTLNGQALACSEMPAAQRAKALMLAHSPKSETYGNAFQASTQDAFMAQTKDNAPCPTAEALSEQLGALETRLNALLPAQAAQSTHH